MYSLKKIVQNIRAFSQGHKQINSFFYGYLDDALNAKDILFPLLVCTLEPKSVEERKDSFGFSLLVVDRIYDLEGDIGMGNELFVQSQTEQICKDAVEYFKERLSDDGLTLQLPISLEPFDYRKNEELVGGWRMPITFTQDNQHDYCSIPIDDQAIPESDRFVTIYNIDTGATIAQPYPPERYGVLVFSGISGGNAGTVFTNQIVGA